MRSINIDTGKTDISLIPGLEIVKSILPLRFYSDLKEFNISFRKSDGGLYVKVNGNTAAIHYEYPNQAFRALGSIAGIIKLNKHIVGFKEKQFFSLISVMLDVSRNAVPKIEKLKELLAHLALMGINGFMLYTETNYEIPGEKFWGYNTGKYTITQLKELSLFAEKLGIEMIPCIQTLAHLRRALHWEAYQNVKDTETVMMVDADATYTLIEKMIKAAAAPYKSKRIHIGMDEAWDLGLGSYLKQKGYTKPYTLMNRHLKKVLAITRKHGLEPMMWADMYFRAGSETGTYYDENAIVPENIIKDIPDDVSLIYWDYYHFDKKTYNHWIDRHQELSDKIIMAPGVQTWNRFWAYYPYAFSTIQPALDACKEKRINEIIMTAWGDDGNECDLFSFLPVMQYYAEHSFNRKVDDGKFHENLVGTCDIEFNDWKKAGELDYPSSISKTSLRNNISKILLWEDPLFGPFQIMLKGFSLKNHFSDIERNLEKSVKKKAKFYNRLMIPYMLSKILCVKCDFPTRLYEAYKQDNRDILESLVRYDIPFLMKEIRKLWNTHRYFWYETNIVYGWETLETRYGGLLIRLESTQSRIKDYLSGKIERIDELEGERLVIRKLKKGQLPTISYAGCCTATPDAVNN